MRATLASLLALSLLAPSGVALQDADPPRTDEEGKAAPRLEIPSDFTPGRQLNRRTTEIQSIAEHRKVGLPYVMRMVDVPALALAGVDIEADPVLYIGESPVSRSAFRRRALLYMAAGELENHALRAITATELASRQGEGQDISDVAVSQEDIAAKLAEYEAMQRMRTQQQAPADGGDPEAAADEAVRRWHEQIEASIGWEQFNKLLAADVQFEKVFLPLPKVSPEEAERRRLEFQAMEERGESPLAIQVDASTVKPDWMPQATWDAFQLTEQGRGLLGFVITSERTGAGLPALFKPSILSQLRDNLRAIKVVRFFFDEDMDDDVLMRIADQEVSVDAAWALVQPQLVDADIELILRELITLKAARKVLEDSGNWIEGDEWESVWKDYQKEFEGTLLPLKTVIMFRGYSSLDRFREHYRYTASYNKMRKATLTDDEVLDHFQTGGRLFFERGEATLAPAFNPVLGGVADNAAYARAAAELAAFIEEHPDDWLAVQKKFPHPAGETKLKAQRNMLRMRLGESELSQIATGYGLLHDIFYHGVEGEVFGPYANRMRHHQWASPQPGVWAVKLVGFEVIGSLPQFVKGDTNYDLAYDDFLNLEFLDWLSHMAGAMAPAVRLP